MKTHHSIARTGIALMIGILVLAFSSCKKSPETIGNNLISENNYIYVCHTDTVAVLCHSYLDSVATGNVTNALIGAMKDPVFGTTEAGFYTQFRPSVAGQSFGNNPVVDSLVLQLYIAGYYGDTTTLQTAHVYELNDTLSIQETYYNYSEVSTDVVDHAGGYQFYPHPTVKCNLVGNDTVTQPIIRIPLSQELGNYLVGLDTTAYSRPDLFKEYFKGLYVTCDPVGQGGAISYINLTNNSFSMLQLYYHDASTPDKAMRYSFFVTSSDAYFNHFDHDYSQGSQAFTDQLLDGQTALGQEMVYLQTMGGVRTRIQFPNLAHWQDTLQAGHIVVNEAQLIIPAASLSLDSIYKAPQAFVLTGFNADNSTYLLPDYYEGANFFGGSYNATKNAVVFRISEYMQSVIMGKKDDYGLSLGINGGSYNAQRFVINGPEAPEGERMRLEVTYSIVNE